MANCLVNMYTNSRDAAVAVRAIDETKLLFIWKDGSDVYVVHKN